MEERLLKDDLFCLVERNLLIGSYQSICLLQERSQITHESTNSHSPTKYADVSTTTEPSNRELEASKAAVLTVDSRKLPKDLVDTFAAYKYISVDDSLQFEFIRYFDECCAFIEDQRTLGKDVLVHCNAGLSRSATIVTAYLMKEHGVDVKDALDRLRKARSAIEPNSNFHQQLLLYQGMGCKLDSSNPSYRQWRLRLLTQTGFPVVEIETLLAAGPDSGSSDLFCYRLCRCPLFGLANQLTHPVKHAASADGDTSEPPYSIASSACVQREIFIEPVAWMKDEIMQTEGKLNCPQCAKKVGAFSWFGEKCPCGVFVTPAFHMDKGKVEIRRAIPR
ncbi:putative Dual specificity protein phosphatase 12 [Hypsibius exemplaris]|uniref:protein-tyrosine-phosphatase n=1 Tax=Hypsibius exemplaris TaxID=2072580 RepID=A0A1W0XF20_HYPEX|nr:putative Dual specificity protein phosphatase 12 [Hypsibius exemplaris]